MVRTTTIKMSLSSFRPDRRNVDHFTCHTRLAPLPFSCSPTPPRPLNSCETTCRAILPSSDLTMGGQDGGRSHTDRSTPRKRRPLSPSTLYAYAILALTIAILSILLGLSYIPALCPDRHMHVSPHQHVFDMEVFDQLGAVWIHRCILPRSTLQIPRSPNATGHFVVRHRQLGRVGVLQICMIERHGKAMLCLLKTDA